MSALVVVLGIFGMHVLAHHGTTHPPVPENASASAYVHDAVGGAGQHAAQATGTDLGVASGPSRDRGSDHALGDMVMLCVALLAAAGTVLGLRTFVRRSPRPWALLAVAVADVSPLRRLARLDTGPPPVWQFSVIRC